MGKVLKGRAAGQNHAKFTVKSSAAQSVLTALERHIEKHDDIEYRTKQVQRPWTHLSPVRWRITLRFADRDVVGSLWDARSRWYLRPWWVQQAGKTDGDQILKHEKLLIEIRSIIGDHENIQEPCLIDIIAKLAKKRESTWHLAKEGPAWTKSLAQMLRAMLKDISLEVKRVNKGQRGASGGPKWIRPFLSSSSTAEECDEADEVEPEEDPRKVRRRRRRKKPTTKSMWRRRRRRKRRRRRSRDRRRRHAAARSRQAVARRLGERRTRATSRTHGREMVARWLRPPPSGRRRCCCLDGTKSSRPAARHKRTKEIKAQERGEGGRVRYLRTAGEGET